MRRLFQRQASFAALLPASPLLFAALVAIGCSDDDGGGHVSTGGPSAGGTAGVGGGGRGGSEPSAGSDGSEAGAPHAGVGESSGGVGQSSGGTGQSSGGTGQSSGGTGQSSGGGAVGQGGAPTDAGSAGTPRGEAGSSAGGTAGDVGAGGAAGEDTRSDDGLPNILTIVADDLGFSDLGAFGGEISTPNLDALAGEGRILTGHRAASLCAPTRAMLISGTDSHAVGLGRMGGGIGAQIGEPGYEGYLTDNALSVAELLGDAGYHTYIAGKWHLGDTEEHSPKARGFERSYVLLGGGAAFFNEFEDPPNDAQTKLYREDGVYTLPPEDFYATDFYTDKLISYIESNRADGKPFFAFAAYTSPHWPLQAPPEYIDRYRGDYDAGYEVIREARLERMKARGIIPESFTPNPLLPSGGTNPEKWDELTPAERGYAARRMEIYAAMVENLDANVGRIIGYLKRIGEYDDTFIFFQSDNGPEGGARDGLAQSDLSRSGAVVNTLANLGKPGSYIGVGPRWAEVSASPFRLWKSYTTEGGVAVPAIVRLPRQDESQPHFDGTTHVTDFLPTLLELAGIPNPGDTYAGRDVTPISGHSLLPVLEGRANDVRPPGEPLVWEHANHRYVIQDNWKLLWLSAPYGPRPRRWSLYDLASDRGEIDDLSGSEPEIVLELSNAWDEYAERYGVVLTE